jgi:hypothetical protein
MSTTRKSPQPALKVVDEAATDPATAAEPLDMAADEAKLDEAERLAAAAILTDDDGDEPGQKDEETLPLVEKLPPRFSSFRARKLFDLWGTTYREGKDDVVYFTTKDFAVNFEEDVELRRVRVYETVTPDGVCRLIHVFLPEANGRGGGLLWNVSKLAALEHATTCWTTMRSRTKLGQYTFRPSAKDHGAPKFSALTLPQHILNLKKLGRLVDSKDHPFYRLATDTEE